MSIVLTNDSNYTAIASSIRSKLGVSTTYLPSEMSGAIDSIPVGSSYSITVTTSHCTASTSNPTSIGEGNIAELIITPDAGYELAPPTVTGASLRKKGADRIEIENPTGNVTINIEAIQPDYFWVENVGTSKAYFSSKDGFMYSTDKLNWTTSAPSFPVGAKVYIKGNIGKTTNNGQTPIPTYGSDIAIGGNVFTLLDYSGVLSDYNIACQYMFYSNSNIVDASQLYINKVGFNVCYHMFYNCSKLVSPPQLPATTLAQGCYYEMFYGCTSLTTAPTLPATTLANNCYRDMFNGCTSLTTAPQLTATTLAQNCYYSMFVGCTSLTTVQLPATILAVDCYHSMFEGCTSLTTAPSLPATTLAHYCYYNMFKGCSSLVTPPELPAVIGVNEVAYCYNAMFSSCTSLKVYSTSGEGHDVEWRIPSEGVIYNDGKENYSCNMFFYTTGDYQIDNVQFKAGEAVVVYTQNQPV